MTTNEQTENQPQDKFTKYIKTTHFGLSEKNQMELKSENRTIAYQSHSVFWYFYAFHDVGVKNEQEAIALANAFSMVTWDEEAVITKDNLYHFFGECVYKYPCNSKNPNDKGELLAMMCNALIVLLRAK